MSKCYKYASYIESAPYEKETRLGTGIRKLAVDITCGTCNEKFTTIFQDHLAATKASRCKLHFGTKCSGNPDRQEPIKKKSLSGAQLEGLAIQETFKQEIASLEESMVKQLEKYKAMVEEKGQEGINVVNSLLKQNTERWSSFENAMAERFPHMRKPINAETIPAQMGLMERTMSLKAETDKKALSLEIAELKLRNNSLTESNTTLNNKFKEVIEQRDERPQMAQYKRKLEENDKLNALIQHLERDNTVQETAPKRKKPSKGQK